VKQLAAAQRKCLLGNTSFKILLWSTGARPRIFFPFTPTVFQSFPSQGNENQDLFAGSNRGKRHLVIIASIAVVIDGFCRPIPLHSFCRGRFSSTRFAYSCDDNCVLSHHSAKKKSQETCETGTTLRGIWNTGRCRGVKCEYKRNPFIRTC